MKDEASTRLDAASRRFDATRATDTSPLGRWRRAEARLELYRALVADGWEPEERATHQAGLDELAVSRPAPAGVPARPGTTALQVA